MKFAIRRADTDRQHEKPHPAAVFDGEDWWIEINTIDDLLNIMREVKSDLIIEQYREPSILIYDDYIE